MISNQIHTKIDKARQHIAEIESSISGTKGVIQDTLNIVLPLHKAELEILEDLATKVRIGF